MDIKKGESGLFFNASVDAQLNKLSKNLISFCLICLNISYNFDAVLIKNEYSNSSVPHTSKSDIST